MLSADLGGNGGGGTLVDALVPAIMPKVAAGVAIDLCTALF